MENTTKQPGGPVEPTKSETAHDLAQRMIEDPNFHVSEEQLKNIDTSNPETPVAPAAADELADNLEKDGSTNASDLIGN